MPDEVSDPEAMHSGVDEGSLFLGSRNVIRGQKVYSEAADVAVSLVIRLGIDEGVVDTQIDDRGSRSGG